MTLTQGRWLICLPLLILAMACPCSGQGRDLVVTEIGFNGVEFLEFQNLSDTDLDLHGFTVFGGIDAFLTGVLAPGEHAVIVNNETAFRGEYGSGPRVLVTYQRKLDDLTENIVVRDPDGIEILRFVYSTAGSAWPRDTNEDEYPLELIAPENPETNLRAPASWRRSFARLGSPGVGSDSDVDGLDDAWEMFFLGSLEQGATDDPDGDELDNGTERRLLTSPISTDTDEDGLADNHETMTGIYVSREDAGTDPLNWDTDEDGLRDGTELPIGDLVDGQYATDPNDADSDDDTFSDGDEVLYRGDPLDRTLGPRPPEIVSFSSARAMPHAGEPIELLWDVRGSSSRNLGQLPAEPTRISNSSSGAIVLPMNRKPLIHAGSVWRYDNSTTDYGTDWRDPGFDDSTWSVALAPFGNLNYGFTSGIDWVTDVPVQADAPTTYFRGEFLMPDRVPGNRLEIVWGADDGGALYIDGNLENQVRLRDPFDRSSYASRCTTPDYPEVFPPNPIGPGPISIAAENHLLWGDCVGLFFDLELNCVQHPTGVYTYLLEAHNPYGSVQAELVIEILDDLPAMQTYSEWAVENIPAEFDRSENADIDGDDRDNVMEFLTGSDPFVRDPHPISMEIVRYTEGKYSGSVAWVNVSFDRHRNPANAGLRIEQSSDGINWKVLPTVFDVDGRVLRSLTVLDETLEQLTYRIFDSPRPKLFRLRAINVE